jgi:hypothetical protein
MGGKFYEDGCLRALRYWCWMLAAGGSLLAFLFQHFFTCGYWVRVCVGIFVYDDTCLHGL